jgi:hypothetical protein
MQLSSTRILGSGIGLVGMVALAFALSGHESPSSPAKISMPEDWSHHHVVFSNPTTLEQTWRVKQDPRFWHQWYRRNVHQVIPVAESPIEESRERDENLPWHDGDWFRWFPWFPWRHPRPNPRNSLKRDWSISLGPNASVGAGNYPAKFSFDITTANCASATNPDFVVFNTGVATSGQASIVAYDNLYSGCTSGIVPTTYWSYNTGGAVVTSVVLSLDGTQVAFVQTPTSSTHAILVLLKWAPTADGATSTAPDPINIVLPSVYPNCTPLPCMTLLPLSGSANDTLSSPFYDYFNDALYVGDDSGSLHKFQPVFVSGTPAEVGSPWPVLIGGGFNKLDSPVLDSASGNVFVGTAYNGSSGAQLFSVNSSSGTVVGTSSSLGKGNGLVAGPVVDSSAGQVYAFVGTDNSTGSVGSTCFGGGHPCAAVYQFTTSFTSGLGIEARASAEGPGTGTFTMYIGAFDNAYYTSANSTGTLYVCGNVIGIGTPFRIPVSAGVMSTTSLGGFPFGSVASPGNLPCGPLTEVFNSNQNSGANSGGPAGTDKLFVSSVGPGTTNPCFNNGTGGCVMDLPITVWQPGTNYTLGQEILDTTLNIRVVTSVGSSGSTQPTWPSPGAGGSIFTTDGSVQWVYKEGLGITGSGAWTAHTVEPQGIFFVDGNGNAEVVTSNSGTTGSTQPIWPMTIGSTTMDGTAEWVNAGPVDNFYLTMAGGTSGIIVDNIVPSGTLGGGSQVYFSPLSLGFSTCLSGNGCAVQASQAALK